MHTIDGISNVLYKNVINFGCARSSLQHACLIVAGGILVPQPEMEPVSPVLGVQNLIHWTTREVPVISFLKWEVQR